MVEEIHNDIADDMGNIDDLLTISKDEIVTGKIYENFKKVRTQKKLTVKDCYETAYGRIA